MINLKRILLSISGLMTALPLVLAAESTSFQFDADNQLVGAAFADGTVGFEYDANGNRTAATVTPGDTVAGHVVFREFDAVRRSADGFTVRFLWFSGVETTGFRVEAGTDGSYPFSSDSLSVGPHSIGSGELALVGLDPQTEYSLRIVEESTAGDIVHGGRVAYTGSVELADLSVSRSPLASVWASGESETYFLTVTNDGAGVARSVRVVEEVRGGFEWVGHLPDLGTSELDGNARIVWEVGDLAPGATAQCSLTVKATFAGQASLNALAETISHENVVANNARSFVASVEGGLPVTLSAQGTTTYVDRGDPVSLEVEVSSPTAVTWQWYYGQLGDRSIALPGENGSILEIPEFHHDGRFWVLLTNGAGELEVGPFTLLAHPGERLYWTGFEETDGFAGDALAHPDISVATGVPTVELLSSYFFGGGQAWELGAVGLAASEEWSIFQELALGAATDRIWAISLDFARVAPASVGGGLFTFALDDAGGSGLLELTVDLGDGTVRYTLADGGEGESDFILPDDRPYSWNLVVDFQTGQWSLVTSGSVMVAPTPVLSQLSAYVPGSITYGMSAPEGGPGAGSVVIDDLRIRELPELPKPEIITQPTEFTAFAGQIVGLSIEAAGEEPLAYRWYRGPVGDAEQSQRIFSIGPSAEFRAVEDGETYWVEVSNIFGTTVSAPITSVIEAAYVAYGTDFTVDDDGAMFTVGQPILGQNGWQALLNGSGELITGGNRIVDAGNGDLALEIGGGSIGGESTLWLDIPIPGLSGFGINRQVSFEITLTDPIAGNDDYFGLFVGNIDYEKVALLEFGYADTRIFATANGEGETATGYRWEPGIRYRVDLFFDQANGRFSVYMNGAWVVRDEPLMSPPGGQEINQMQFFWTVNAAPGENTVLIDDFAYTAIDGYVTPRIDAMSPPVTVASGDSAEVEVSASGFGALSYAWYRGFPGDTSQPVGADAAVLALEALTASGRYWVRVTNEVGSIDSPSVHVAVESPYWGQYDFVSDPEVTGFGSGQVVVDGNLAAVFRGEGNPYVWILERRAGQWFVLTRFNPGGSYSHEMGRSMALDDGVLAIGAPKSAYPLSEAGRVYLWSQDESDPAVWTVQNIYAPEPAVGDRFGHSVDLQDGILAVGAPQSAGEPFWSYDKPPGEVHLFGRETGGAGNWGLITTVAGSDLGQHDQFGASVALDSGRLVVGAPYHDGQEPSVSDSRRSGAVYLFGEDEGGMSAWGETAKVLPAIRLNGSEFGMVVDLAGDRLAVGAPGYEGSVFTDEGPGQAFVFREEAGNPGGWLLEQSLADPFPTPHGEFGGSLVLPEGDLLLVGQGGFPSFPGAPSGAGFGVGDSHPGNAISLFGFDPDGSGTWRHLQWPQRLFPDEAPTASPHLLAFDGGDLAIGDAVSERVYFFSEPTPALPPKLQRDDFLLAAFNKNPPSVAEVPGMRLGDYLDGWIVDGANEETGIILTFDERSVAGSWQYQRAGETFWRLVPAVSPIAGLVLRMDDRIRFLPDRWAFGEATLRFRGWSGIAARSGEVLRVVEYAGPGELTEGIGRLNVRVIDTNAYPVFATFAPSEAVSGFPFEYRIAVTDADAGQALAITAEELPGWLTFTDHGDRTALLSGDPGESEVGVWTVRLRAFDGESGPAEQVFTLTVNPAGQTGWALLDSVVPERDTTSPQSVSQFGQALDGETLAVATAIYQNPPSGGYNFPGQHEVIIYDRDPDSGEFVETARVPPPPGGFPSRGYGSSLALQGDILAIGDTEWNNPDSFPLYGESWRGRVLVHGRHVGGTDNWGLIREIIPSQAFPDDEFGSEVTLDGGVLLVVSHYDNTSSDSKGGVHIFIRDEGGLDQWGEVARIVPADAGLDRFSTNAFAASATTVVYGETNWSFTVDWEDPLRGTGRIHVFSAAPDGTWSYHKVIPSPTTIRFGGFGRTLHLSGDRLVVSGNEADWGTRIYQEDLGGMDNWGFVEQIDARGNGIDLRGDRLLLYWSGALDLFEDSGTGFAFADRLSFGYQSSSFGGLIDQSGDIVVGGGGTVGPSQRIGVYGIGVRNIAPFFNGPVEETIGAASEDSASADVPRFRISDLMAGRASDFNGDPIAAAIRLKPDEARTGNWYFQQAGGSAVYMYTHSTATYYLLDPDSEIWFVPNADYAGPASPALEVRAWDMTTGVRGSTFVPEGDVGGSSALSTGSATWNFNVEETPDAPEFVASNPLTVTIGQPFDVLLEFTDADAGDALTIETGERPDWMQVSDLGDGRIRMFGVPPDGASGAGRVVVTAQDSYGLSGSGLLEFTVFAGGELPLALVPDDLVAQRAFGRDLAGDGDWLAVGSEDNRVFLYRRDETTADGWVLHTIVEDPFSGFGQALDLDGDRLVVGGWNTSGANGTVVVYERNHGGDDNWGETVRLNPVPTSPSFGRTVDLDGDNLLVGASGENVVRSGDGAAYLFHHDSSNGWTQTVRLTVDGLWGGAGFGQTVALSGDGLAVLSSHSPTDSYNNLRTLHLFRFDPETDPGNLWVSDGMITAPEGAGTPFGADFDLEGDLLVVGQGQMAPVRVYQRQGATDWGQVGEVVNSTSLYWKPPSPYGFAQEGDFGMRLDLEDGRLLVAAPKVNSAYGRGFFAEYVPVAGDPSEWERVAVYHNHTGVSTDLGTFSDFADGFAQVGDDLFVSFPSYRSNVTDPVSPGGLVLRYERSAVGSPAPEVIASEYPWPSLDRYGVTFPEVGSADIFDAIARGRDAVSRSLVFTSAETVSGHWEYKGYNELDQLVWLPFPDGISPTQAFTVIAGTMLRFVQSGVEFGNRELATVRAFADGSIVPYSPVDLTDYEGGPYLSTGSVAIRGEIVDGNGAPVLTGDPIDPVLNPLGSEADGRTVTRVGDLMATVATDPNGDPLGMAVTGFQYDSVTRFEYSEDGGATWTSLTSYPPTAIKAFWGPEVLFRYVGTQSGNVHTPLGIQFRAWDGRAMEFSPSGYGNLSAYSSGTNIVPFAWEDVPDPPTVEMSGDSAAIPGEPYIAGFALSDADSGDTVTAELLAGPAWATAVQEGNLLVVTGSVPADSTGSFSLTVRATDSTGRTTEVTHTVDVIAGFTIDTGLQMPATVASSLTVSVSGDLIAVGNRWAAVDGVEQAGEVYIFRETGFGSGWELEKILRAPVVAANGYFGTMVRLVGNRLFVSASRETDNQSATLIFERDFGGAGNWGLRKRIAPSVGVVTDGERIVLPVTVFFGTSRYEIYTRNSGGADNWGLSHTVSYAGSSPQIDGEFLAAFVDSSFVREFRIHRDSSGWEQALTIAPDGISGIRDFLLRDGELFVTVRFRGDHLEYPSEYAILHYDLWDGGTLQGLIPLGTHRLTSSLDLTPDGNRLVVRIQVNGEEPLISHLLFTRTQDDFGDSSWDLPIGWWRAIPSRANPLLSVRLV